MPGLGSYGTSGGNPGGGRVNSSHTYHPHPFSLTHASFAIDI